MVTQPTTDGAEALPTPLERFLDQAERAASIVHRVDDIARVSDLVLAAAAGAPVSISRSAARRYPDLLAALSSASELLQPDTAESAARAGVGVMVGEAFVPETGSVLVTEHHLDDRLVSMLSPVLVQIVQADSMLPTLDDVATYLSDACSASAGGYHALMTGPSRTADIERSLTIGVQGPYTLHVVLLSAPIPDPDS